MGLELENVPCGLCGSRREKQILLLRDIQLRMTGETFPLVECGKCGLRYLNPRPAPREILKLYPELSEMGDLARDDLDLAGMIDLAEKDYGSLSREAGRLRKGKKGRILEMGCGSGKLLSLFLRDGWEVEGIEPLPTFARLAEKLLRARIQTAPLETADLGEKRWDAIALCHVLEHLSSPREALRRARAAIRNDGLLIVAVPNAGSRQAAFFGEDWFPYDAPRHLYHFSQKTLIAMLKDAGFETISVRQDFSITVNDLRTSHRYRTARLSGDAAPEGKAKSRFLRRMALSANKKIAQTAAGILVKAGTGSAINVFCRPADA